MAIKPSFEARKSLRKSLLRQRRTMIDLIEMLFYQGGYDPYSPETMTLEELVDLVAQLKAMAEDE